MSFSLTRPTDDKAYNSRSRSKTSNANRRPIDIGCLPMRMRGLRQYWSSCYPMRGRLAGAVTNLELWRDGTEMLHFMVATFWQEELSSEQKLGEIYILYSTELATPNKMPQARPYEGWNTTGKGKNDAARAKSFQKSSKFEPKSANLGGLSAKEFPRGRCKKLAVTNGSRSTRNAVPAVHIALETRPPTND
ncbi:hypothetical protein R3P38DRAFT_2800012 [Favolaschia claudopus]|uniref:Uncharacterized protein n=1 Tax=Favolaschia claudopus TaxID=2862362 RepID=A0AAV9ZZR9_9AGAR